MNCCIKYIDTLPATGSKNTMYIDKLTGDIWFWNGEAFFKHDSRPYKVYTAILNQTGTDAPVPTVLEDTIGISSSDFARALPGAYSITKTGAFTLGKTFIFPGNGYNQFTSPSLLLIHSSANTITISNALAGVGTDGMTNRLIEIRVYR